MERFQEPPVQKQLAIDTANSILSGNDNSDWNDSDILTEYLSLIDVTAEQYKTFVSEDASIGDLRAIEYFKPYVTEFEQTQQKFPKNYTPEQIEQERKDRLYKKIRDVEKDKLIYFTLLRGQETVVITAPSDNTEQKRFLGYDWSNRKGSEGIVLNPNGGYLTNVQNRFAHGTLATFVRNAFSNMRTIMGEETTLQKYVASYRTVDMLDFSKADFDKAIKTTTDKKIIVISNYPLVKLGSFAEIAKGKSITKADAKEGNVKVVAGGVDYAYLHNVANREANIITISASGANAGYVNFWKEPIFASDCTTVRGRTEIETLYLYNFLQSIQDQIYYLQKGSAQPHVYPNDIADLQIPQVEETKMQEIVAECAKVDEEYHTSRMSIEEYRKKIAQVFENLQVTIRMGG